MALQHNKKRNIGLINEFFARYIAESILDNKDKNIQISKEIFVKHFHRGTDLYKELRLFQTLHETKLGSPALALSLIEKVKEACKMQSQARIDLEKTALLHEINTKLNKDSFFDYKIPYFRDYATIQILLNHWRSGILTENISEISQLEEKLIGHIVHQEPVESTSNSSVLGATHEDIDKLLIHVMTEKLNKKFGDTLNQDQRNILKHYVFCRDNEISKNTLTTILETTKKVILSKIDSSMQEDSELKNLGLNLNEVKELINKDYSDTTNPNDQMIAFYMKLMQLNKELSAHE